MYTHGLSSQMVEIYKSIRLWLDNCEIFLYREVKLSENELLTIDCVSPRGPWETGGGGGGGGLGHNCPEINCEIALEP